MSLIDIIDTIIVDEYLIPVIDKQIDKQIQQNNLNRSSLNKFLHPSQVAGQCLRYGVLKYLIPNDTIHISLAKIFNDGTMFHDWYRNKYLGPAGVLYGDWICSRCGKCKTGFMPINMCECNHAATFCEEKCSKTYDTEILTNMKKRSGCIFCGQNNVEAWGEWLYKEPSIFIPELNMKGSSDGLVYIAKNWYVLEIKTMNTFVWQKLKEPQIKHRSQGYCYLKGFKNLSHPFNKAEGILFLYINKNQNSNIRKKQYKEKEYLVVWSDEADEVFKNIEKVKNAIDNQELPSISVNCQKSKCLLYKICDKFKTYKEAEKYGNKLQTAIKNNKTIE